MIRGMLVLLFKLLPCYNCLLAVLIVSDVGIQVKSDTMVSLVASHLHDNVAFGLSVKMSSRS